MTKATKTSEADTDDAGMAEQARLSVEATRDFLARLGAGAGAGAAETYRVRLSKDLFLAELTEALMDTYDPDADCVAWLQNAFDLLTLSRQCPRGRTYDTDEEGYWCQEVATAQGTWTVWDGDNESRLYRSSSGEYYLAAFVQEAPEPCSRVSAACWLLMEYDSFPILDDEWWTLLPADLADISEEELTAEHQLHCIFCAGSPTRETRASGRRRVGVLTTYRARSALTP